MGNAWLFLKPDGTWVAERGGRQGYQHAVGPYSNLEMARRVLRDRGPELSQMAAKALPNGNEKRRRMTKKVRSVAEKAWRGRQGFIRAGEWRQVSGGVDPSQDDTIWRKGSEIVVLVSFECEEEPLWEMYETDLETWHAETTWIEWEKVAAYCDTLPHDAVAKLECAAAQYGWHNTIGNGRTTNSIRKLMVWLSEIGIEADIPISENMIAKEEEALARWRKVKSSKADRALLNVLPTHFLRVNDAGFVDTTCTSQVTTAAELIDAAGAVFRLIGLWLSGDKGKLTVPENLRYITPYYVPSIDENGVISVGCNLITVKEVVRFYRDDLLVKIPARIRKGVEEE